eukprot:294435_1
MFMAFEKSVCAALRSQSRFLIHSRSCTAATRHSGTLSRLTAVCKWRKHAPWAKLIKLDLSALTVTTAAGGYMLAGGSLFNVSTFLGAVGGSALCASSAAIFNQLRERTFDARMRRTQSRPLVRGDISVNAARSVGWGSGLGGTGILLATTNPTTALLGAATILSYVHVYTPLKRVCRFNTELGALVGAIPPLMGWAAATGGAVCCGEAAFLVGTLFTWQMHHFMAIAWKYRTDYARAGFQMISCDDPTGDRTLKKGAFYAASMALLPPAAWAMGLASPMYVVAGTAMNIPLWVSYARFWRKRDYTAAHNAMLAGFPQLVGLLGLLVFFLSNKEQYRAFRETEPLREIGAHLCAFLAYRTLLHFYVTQEFSSEELLPWGPLYDIGKCPKGTR